MSYADKTFAEISRDVAEDFLHSVVVVDDQAFLHTGENARTLTAPARGRGQRQPAQLQQQISPNDGEEPVVRRRQDLDAKSLIDTFAASGLVCAVLRPQRGDGGKKFLGRRTDRATQKADIVILDWRLGSEESIGTTTLELINTIIASDQRDRLRLIAVYTGEPDLNQIAERINDFLSERNDGPFTRTGFMFVKGSARISIYAKSGSRSSTPEIEARTFTEAELPSQLIGEFAEMTQGLLSNVALKSLGALRANTHRIIRKFCADLDAPYLAHRALMTPAREAEQHPVPLLSSEIQDVLEDGGVGTLVGPEVIQAWLTAQVNGGLGLENRVKDMTATDVRGALLDLIEKGVKDETSSQQFSSWADLLGPLKDSANRDGLSTVTDLLTFKDVVARDRDLEFALLMGVRSRYDAPNPILTLGTIISEELGNEQKYLFCIQPPCDSIRLSGKRAFPFLRMVDAELSTAKDFDVVVRDGEKLKALRIDFHPYSSRLIVMNPGRGHGEVRAMKDGNSTWIFQKGADKQPTLRWIADVKPAQAQRVANVYGATISRVGLTESEWLRRMAKVGG